MESYVVVGFDVIGFGDFVFGVGCQGVFDGVDVVFVYWGVVLGVVGEVGVDGNVDYFDVVCLEFWDVVVQGDQFGWVDEGEVQWIEEYQVVFVFDGFGQGEVFDDFVIVQYCGNVEVRCFFIYEYVYFMFFLSGRLKDGIVVCWFFVKFRWQGCCFLGNNYYIFCFSWC